MTGVARLVRMSTAAHLVGCHRSTLYGLIARGELAVHHVDGRLLFDRRDVLKVSRARARRRRRTTDACG